MPTYTVDGKTYQWHELMNKLQNEKPKDGDHCQCDACSGGVTHDSDCAVHNMPEKPNGECDCGAGRQR